MTTIYVDAAIVDVGRGSAVPDPREQRSLRLLREAEHDVVLVVDGSSAGSVAGEWPVIAPGAVPARPPAPAWYLTSDVDRCRGRSALLRTVLVGATPGPAAIHRCDAVARDVAAAVLEILATEAMEP